MWDEGTGAPGRGRADGPDPVTEYLPTFAADPGGPMTRPRTVRRRRPALRVALVAVTTIALGSGAGLLLANTLNDPNGSLAGPTVSVAAPTGTDPGTGPSDGASPALVSSSTAAPTGSTPAARPSSSTSKASRSQPSRTPKTSSSTTSKPPTSTPSTSKAPSGAPVLEKAVLTLVNQERAKAGCKAVTANAKLTLAARRHSQYMADSGKHEHEGIGDGTPQTRIEAAGYKWRGWGENIAWGYSSAASVMAGWMKSPGHKANILNCSYQEIGIGVDRAGTSWTQDFGIPA